VICKQRMTFPRFKAQQWSRGARARLGRGHTVDFSPALLSSPRLATKNFGKVAPAVLYGSRSLVIPGTEDQSVANCCITPWSPREERALGTLLDILNIKAVGMSG
jgi:hypothetical protein